VSPWEDLSRARERAGLRIVAPTLELDPCDPLGNLQRVAAHARSIDVLALALAREANRAGHGWRAIAAALGVSKSAAHERARGRAKAAA
jgi:hypothetical protein